MLVRLLDSQRPAGARVTCYRELLHLIYIVSNIIKYTRILSLSVAFIVLLFCFRDGREVHGSNLEEKMLCQTSLENVPVTSPAKGMLLGDQRSFIAIRAPPTSIVEVLDPLDVEQCYRELG